MAVITDKLADVFAVESIEGSEMSAVPPWAVAAETATAGTSALRPVGPGDDGGAPSGPDVAQQVVEHLAIARTPEVTATDPWADAGRKILRFHLARMLTQVPAVVAGDDPEAVHDMRVAARRVRAVWRVFGDAYDRGVVRAHVRELRSLGDRLGEVRDLDVQLAILGAQRESRSKRERVALAPLVEAWTAERAIRHRALVAQLASAWFGMVVASHEAFITAEELGEAVGPVPVPAPDQAVAPVHVPATVRTRTPAVTWNAYGAVWAFDPVVADADVDTLHQLRIATKWLRYTLEFVREPIEPGATELIRRVVLLQDHLGDIHDLHAASALAREMAAASTELSPANQRAIERFAVAQDLRVDRLRRRLGPAWRGVADPEFRRSLGRALAGH